MLGTHCSAVLLSCVVSSNTSSSDQRAPAAASFSVLTPALLTSVLMSWQAYSRRFLQQYKRYDTEHAGSHRQKYESLPVHAGESGFGMAGSPLDLNFSGCIAWRCHKGHLHLREQVRVGVITARLYIFCGSTAHSTAAYACAYGLCLVSTTIQLGLFVVLQAYKATESSDVMLPPTSNLVGM